MLWYKFRHPEECILAFKSSGCCLFLRKIFIFGHILDYKVIKGKFVKSVTAAGVSATSATVTIVYAAGIPGVSDGDNLVYTGTCAAGSGLTWAIAGTVPARLQPKI